MKLKTLVLRNGDVFTSYKNSMIMAMFGYGKAYELLHKQLWRKGRIAYDGDEFTYNNRPVRAIKHYDIKSSSSAPYDRDDVNNLGLNQLFIGQSPYGTYNGDPADGIYHDTCQIVPKRKYLGLFNETEPKLTGHGSIVQTGDTTAIVRYATVGVQTLDTKYYVYEDGLCVELIPEYSYEENAGEGETRTVTVPPTLRVLPLIYTDTGDLVQNRIDFIDNWDDEFELNVIEDGYWYDGFIPMLVIVLSIIIAVLAPELMGATLSSTEFSLAVLGGAVSGIGAVSGNKVFQVLAVVLGVAGAVDTVGKKAIIQEAMESGLSLRTANQIAMESSLGKVFSHFVSGAGFQNLIDIGSDVFKVYQTVSTKTATEQTTPTEEEHIRIYALNDEPYDYVNKVIQI